MINCSKQKKRKSNLTEINLLENSKSMLWKSFIYRKERHLRFTISIPELPRY
jgi:hypothetical protein